MRILILLFFLTVLFETTYCSSSTTKSNTLNDTIKVELTDVYWDFNKASLKEHSFAALDSVIVKLNEEWKDFNFTIYVQEWRYKTESMALPLQRAESIMNYFVSKGILKERGNLDGDVKYQEKDQPYNLPEVYLYLYKSK